jgi:hypothetical protein
VEKLLPNLNLPLLAGTQYWVAALPGASDSSYAWQVNNTGFIGSRSFNGGNGWSKPVSDLAGAFEVLGTPEPGTAGLTMAAAALALLALKLRKR